MLLPPSSGVFSVVLASGFAPIFDHTVTAGPAFPTGSGTITEVITEAAVQRAVVSRTRYDAPEWASEPVRISAVVGLLPLVATDRLHSVECSKLALTTSPVEPHEGSSTPRSSSTTSEWLSTSAQAPLLATNENETRSVEPRSAGGRQIRWVPVLPGAKLYRRAAPSVMTAGACADAAA